MLNYYKNLTQNILTMAPYMVEFKLLSLYSNFKGHPLRDIEKHKKLSKKMLAFLEEGLKADARLCSELNIKRDLPSRNEIKKHLVTFYEVFDDYKNVITAREENNLKTGSDRNYPEYFNRNFHFQTDGYTSEKSAKLYDHQVDILFTGLTTPMRRAILEEFKNFKPKNILELACGTGSATKIVSHHLPKSKITATDISHEYIQYAKKNNPLRNVAYKQMDATEIQEKYECIYQVFLLHELPSKVRNEVIKKQIEHLTDDGKGIIVESIQTDDIPFLNEVLNDFPKYYHEPFYKHYIDHPVEELLENLGAKNIKVTQRLFNKVISFTKN